MLERFDTYQAIKTFRDQEIRNSITDNHQLNQFHDQVMKRVVQIALDHVNQERGNPPSTFSFFVMGSAGRFEQGFCSDQDHGLVYEQTNHDEHEYFGILGNEITKGLDIAGYELCDGNVMCSNPLWCKPEKEWRQQLHDWLDKQDWESVRHLLIFMDARVLVGHSLYIDQLKALVFEYIEETPHLLQRMLENTRRIKKGVGIFKQFLTESHGTYAGHINLKDTAFFPYVNAIRLLAIKEKLHTSSTLERLKQLNQQSRYDPTLINYQAHFIDLLQHRLFLQATSNKISYESSHYVNISHLSNAHKQQLRSILNNGIRFHQQLTKLLEKG